PCSRRSTQPSPVFQVKDYDHPNKIPCGSRCSIMSGCSESTSCCRRRSLSVNRQLDHVHKRGTNNMISCHQHLVVRRKTIAGPMRLSLESSDCQEESTLVHRW